MNKQQRDELRKLADAATPGPWKAEDEGGTAICPHGKASIAVPCHEFNVAEDFNFIAASRAAVPALLKTFAENGVKPDEASKIYGLYEAQTRHLTDMQTIAFKLLKKIG